MDNNQNAENIRKIEKARNDSNNAKVARVAADVAANSGHPIASAIGKGVQVADKATGGKASERLGQALTKANKNAGLRGRAMQKVINKAAESDKIEKASKATSLMNQSKGAGEGSKNDNLLSKTTSSNTKETSSEEQSSGGAFNGNADLKVIKIGLIVTAAVMPLVLFIVICMSVLQVYKNSMNLGFADELTDKQVEEKINKKMSDDEAVNDEFGYSDEVINQKLEENNLIRIASTKYLTRKYSEAQLENLKDFYPDVAKYNEECNSKYAEDCETNLAYDFFFKMYNLYKYYRDNYPTLDDDNRPILDLPLMMSTLMLQSDNIYEVFEANLDVKDRKKTIRKQPVDEYAYDYDWSGYELTVENSTHDMEVLAQHMVSKQVKEVCKDSNGSEVKTNILKDSEIGTQKLTCGEGETYSTSAEYYAYDDEKYKEYLKEFIEKKYYIDEEINIDNANPSGDAGPWREWKQCNPVWGSMKIGSKTMCQVGCLVTSVSIQIARSGTTTTISDNFNPGTFMKEHKKHGGFNGNLFVWNVSDVAPNFVEYAHGVNAIGMTKEALAKKLSSYDSSKYYIILAVSKKNKNEVHHYIALDYVDLQTSKLYMIDPANTGTNDVYSIYKVYKYYVYEKKD